MCFVPSKYASIIVLSGKSDMGSFIVCRISSRVTLLMDWSLAWAAYDEDLRGSFHILRLIIHVYMVYQSGLDKGPLPSNSRGKSLAQVRRPPLLE